MTVRLHELLALFLAACAGLLFEINLTKIFEFGMWSNYAYLVVSTAMFGLGLAGVILTRWPRLLAIPATRFLTSMTALSGLAMWFAFLVINTIPLHLPDAPVGWPQEILNMTAVFVCISLPFVFFGLVMSYLFELRGERANVYYFADLLGAGVGSILLVPLIPALEPQGLVVLCGSMCLVAALMFALGNGRPFSVRGAALAAGIMLVVVGTWYVAPRAAARMPLEVHVAKRHFKADLKAGRIEATRWSALSRVDISSYRKNMKKVWIAGGVNESLITAFDGDYETLRARREATLRRSSETLNITALPHLLKNNHTVCMIGTSGGSDSLLALQCGALRVTGVEMDPSIGRFVTGDYREFAGGLFTDGKYSELVVDEGRSYLKRSGRRFDIIQQVNNATPIAFAKGALNLSENYLLTVESLGEFYDHLTEDGILCIQRPYSIRLLATAVEMFRRRGVAPAEYSKHFVAARGARNEDDIFMMKRSAFTPEEIDLVYGFYEARKVPGYVFYAPYRLEGDLSQNLYHLIATSADPSPYHTVGAFSFTPPTDQRPFFNHIQRLGRADVDRRTVPLLPSEVTVLQAAKDIGRRIHPGDLPPLIVLIEGALLAAVFFGLPLFTTGSLRRSLRRNVKTLGYFACLGIAFIFIEICLIQRLILFLGAPVYSISVVFGSLLIAAGIGSLVSGRIPATRKAIRVLLSVVAGAIVVMHLVIPLLTKMFLGGSFGTRVVVSVLITGTLGFLMGMPMPTGIRYLKEGDAGIISWAWAMNGYFTVIGSALSVIIAVNAGFLAIFFLAALIYAAAPYFLPADAKPAAS